MGLKTWFKRTFFKVEEVPVRARDDEGRFVPDDPETEEDEAWTTKDVSVEKKEEIKDER